MRFLSSMWSSAWFNNLLPIVILLAAIAFVLRRLPKVELGHSNAFKRRRFLNWFPLGLTYAFLYMGRYNLSVAKTAMGLTNAEYGVIGGIGTFVYGLSFVLNGPLTDRWGGRATILISTFGVVICNAVMAVFLWVLGRDGGTAQGSGMFGFGTTKAEFVAIIYALNMYFQSFGAVSIVKVNTAWFHLRERGTFGGVFGILIALGIYFAYDWNSALLAWVGAPWVVFAVPAGILALFFVIDLPLVRDQPSDAGQPDIDTGDVSSNSAGSQNADGSATQSPLAVMGAMLRHPVILTICGIEFCSGFLRNAIMQWYLPFTAQTGQTGFVQAHWGLLLCLAGIFGGMFAGVISDHVFGSRRGPVSAVLYGGLTLGAVVGYFTLDTVMFGWVIVFMSLCVIGVHGMLTAAASMDFAGKKNVGVAVGLIDGLVYAGTGVQFIVLGLVTPQEVHGHTRAASSVVSEWSGWPLAMIPFALLGLILAIRLWNASVKPNAAAAH